MKAIATSLHKFMSSDFSRRVLLSFGVKIASAVVLFGFNVLVARLFGAAGAGVYFLAWTIINIAVTVARMGFENTVIRFAAVAFDQKDWVSIRGLYRHTVIITSIAALVITLFVMSAADFMSVRVFSSPALSPVLALMSLAILPSALYYLHAHLFKGLHKPVQAMAISSLWVPLFVVMMLLVIRTHYGLIGATVAFDMASLFALLLAVWVWRSTNIELIEGQGIFPVQQLLRSSMPMLLGSVVSLVVLWLPTLVLGAYASEADVGVFSAANRVSILISFVLVAVNSVAGSRFAVLYDQGNFRRMEQLGRRIALALSVLVLPVFLVLLVAGDRVMLVFGSEFTHGGFILAVMAGGQMLNVMTGPVGLILSMSGHERVMSLVLTICALLSACLSFWLIPTWGLRGAAVTVATTVAIQNIACAFYVRRKLGIRILF